MVLETPDVLVIGLGAMGSAAAYQLAKRGLRVVGLDRFTPPHTHGSTHGETRITRLAIGEGTQFVPLAQRSQQLWRDIEAQTGAALFKQCGGLVLMHSASVAGKLHGQSDFLGSTVNAAQQFGIKHERLDAAEVAARFPQFVMHGGEQAYFEPQAGYLSPEACVSAQLSLAARHGADLRFGQTVRSITTQNGQTQVHTDTARFRAGTTLVCAGAWIPQLLPNLPVRVKVYRQVLTWFALDDAAPWQKTAESGGAPVFIWKWGAGTDEMVYGFPPIGGVAEVKLAAEQQVVTTHPDSVQREVSEAEIAATFAMHVRGRFRGISARCTRTATCLYTNTDDVNFVIDRLPDAADVIVVSACSGHGFKHSAAIGEALAEMALGGATSGATPAVLRPFSMAKAA